MSLSVKETIDELTIDGKFIWGIDTLMKILRPGCLYEIESSDGQFKITKWYDNWSEEHQLYFDSPSPQQLRDEYIRQKTIAECIEYFQTKQ